MRSLSRITALLLPLALALLPAFPAAGNAEGASEHPESGRRPADIMSYLGAHWLERPNRDEEQQPEKVLDVMALAPGQMVADIGVGTGYFARRIAPRIAPGGKVYGVEVQPRMLELLERHCAEEGIDNVVSVLGEHDDPKLPEAFFDWVLLVDTYHEFQEPRAMLDKIRGALKADGKVALIEYRLLGETAAHIQESHRMSVRQVLAEWTPAGFELVDLLEFLPAQHFFIFRKSACVCDQEE